MVLARGFAAAILVACSVQAAAQQVPMTPELSAVIEAAKKEGQLDIRSTSTVLGGAEGAKIAREGIKRLFGVDLQVNWSPGPAYGPLAALLNQERQAGRKASTDVFAATAVQMSPYMAQGLFQTVAWRKLMPSRIPEDAIEADGRIIRYRTVVPSIIYNLQEAKWVPQIKSFDDLLDPKLKGKFYTTPFLGGFDVMLSDEKWGVTGTTERIRKLGKQVAGLVGCEGVDRIASGEIPALVVDCSGGWDQTLKYRNENVIGSHVIPDMAQKRYGYLAVPSHAAHPNAGILYALYIDSAEGQSKVVRDYFGSDYDGFPDSLGKREIDKLEKAGAKFVDVTMEWWRSHPEIDKVNEQLAKIVREP